MTVVTTKKLDQKNYIYETFNSISRLELLEINTFRYVSITIAFD